MWYRKKDTGKVEMEYCIRILGRGTRRKRGVSILGVLTAILLTAGKSYILTALKLTENDTVYNNIYDKDMGKELHPFGEGPNETGALDIFSTLMVKIPVKADISNMVDANRKAGAENLRIQKKPIFCPIYFLRHGNSGYDRGLGE